MMQFLTPYSLVALFALAIPVMIHLLNRPKPKVIAWGSVKYLQEVEVKKWRSLQFNQIPLLLLRLLLLGALALLLMQPFWKQTQLQTQPINAVYIHPNLLPYTNYPPIQNLLDSLGNNNLHLHYFEPNFPPVDTSKVRNYKAKLQDNWSLLSWLSFEQEQVEIEQNTYVFLSDLMQHYQGKKPSIPSNMSIFILPTPHTGKQLYHHQWLSAKELQLQFAISNAEQLYYQTQTINWPLNATTFALEEVGQLQLIASTDSLQILSKDSLINTQIPLYNANENKDASAKMETYIVHDKNRKQDVRYLTAALKAIRSIEKVALNIEVMSTQAFIKNTPAVSILFWLSDKEVPASLLTTPHPITIIQDADSTPPLQKTKSFIYQYQQGQNTYPTVLQHNGQKANNLPNNKHPICSDGFGNALLSYESLNNNGGIRYHFSSRFHPSYTNWVTSGTFPLWMAGIIQNQYLHTSTQLAAHDVRAGNWQQIRPLRHKAPISTQKSPNKISQLTSLYVPLWLFISILFLIERIWSQRVKED